MLFRSAMVPVVCDVSRGIVGEQKGGPGEGGIDGERRHLWAARGHGHAACDILERRGRRLVWGLQGTIWSGKGTAGFSEARPV